MEHYRSTPDSKHQRYASNQYYANKGQNHSYSNRKFQERKVLTYTPKGQPRMPEHADHQENSITLKELKASLETKIEEYLRTKSEWEVPIPKGTSAYSKAKRAEYVERNLDKAVKYYKISIENNERVESAIKDLATVLHQQGKTEEACKFLEEYRPLYKGEASKFDNLLNNLKKQLTPSGNCHNRTYIIPNVPLSMTEHDIRDLFENSSRIIDVSFCRIWSEEDVIGLPHLKEKTKLCILSFVSYSAARKTIETLIDPEAYEFYWMNMNGDIVGKVGLEIIRNVKSVPEKESRKPSSDLNTNEEERIQRDSAATGDPSNKKVTKSQTEPKTNSLNTQKSDLSTEMPKTQVLPMKQQAENKNDLVIKRVLSYDQEFEKLNISPRKYNSATHIPSCSQSENTWNWAVLVDMGNSDEENEELELQSIERARAKSLRDYVYTNFNRNEKSMFQIYSPEMSNGSGRVVGPAQKMKYDVMSEIKRKEERLQREKHEGINYMQNLIISRNELMDEIRNRKTSLDSSLFTTKSKREEKLGVGPLKESERESQTIIS